MILKKGFEFINPNVHIYYDLEAHLLPLPPGDNYKRYINAANMMAFHQSNACRAAKYFSMKDAPSLWFKIVNNKTYSSYITDNYDIYWNQEDCLFFDKFYSLALSMSDPRVQSLLFAIMIETMKKQNVYGRFNRLGAPDEVEILTEKKFYGIIETYLHKIKSSQRINVVIKSVEDFILSISGGLLGVSIPSRNMILDYHPIIDVLENYDKGIFDNSRLHISKQLQKKIDSFNNTGDRFIKKWANIIPFMARSNAEYIVFDMSAKLTLERDWIIEKLSQFGEPQQSSNLIYLKLEDTNA